MALENLNFTPARTQNIIRLLLVMFFILLSILSSPAVSITLDEPLHYHYGLFVLQGKTDRIDDSSMPVTALNALPQFVSNFLPDGPLKAVLERYFLARLITILFSAGIATLVFRWSRALYGFAAAILSTLLYVLDPNIIAHSQLVTTDVFAAGMIALAFYLLWRFANTRRSGDGLLFIAVLGLSQLVKYTAVALFPLALLVLVIHDWPDIRAAFGTSRVRGIGRYVGTLIRYAVLAVVISTLIINIGFLFNRTLTPFGHYQFRSSLFRSVQSDLPVLGGMPVPVPYPYLEGLDWVRHTDETADRYGNVYLLGRVSKPNGFPGYYLVASALKIPIATQVFVLAALGLYAAHRRRRASFLRDEVFLLVPFLLFTIYFNFLFNAQTGIRYYMVVFPLLYIFGGSLFADWKEVPFKAKIGSLVLVVYLAASVLSYFPYYIPYFNELVWDKTQTYKYLSDSNLDWGQSRGQLAAYLAAHPDAVYDPPKAQAGLIVVGGSDLVGILNSPQQYAWLRDNFKPVDTIAYTYFVYQVSPTQIVQLCASSDYCN